MHRSQSFAVKKFPGNIRFEERLGIMRDFMGRYDPNIPATFSVRHRGDLQNQDKNLTMTAVGFIEVPDGDTREFVLRLIEAKKLTLTCNSTKLSIVRALTNAAKDRNTDLFSVIDL